MQFLGLYNYENIYVYIDMNYTAWAHSSIARKVPDVYFLYGKRKLISISIVLKINF